MNLQKEDRASWIQKYKSMSTVVHRNPFLFTNETGVENMGHSGDEVVVCKLQDKEQDWVLGVSLLQCGFFTQAHPMKQECLHGLREQF